MVKKFLRLFLFIFVATMQVAAQDFEQGGIHYTIVSSRDHTVAVSAAPASRRYQGELVIPDVAQYRGDTYRVVAIAPRAFEHCTQLVSLTVPASVEEIGDASFSECRALKYLVLSDNPTPLRLGSNSYQATVAGEALFHDCPLETLYLGRELQYKGGYFHGYSPFYKKKGLSLVIVGDGVRVLENRAFYGCESLSSVTIGGRVEKIGNYAFYGCKSLRELVVKEGDKPLEIGTNGPGENLFYDAPVATLYLGRNLAYAETVAHLYNPFYKKESLTTVTLGENISMVGARTFYGCRSLASLTIGGRVEKIENAAFSGCTSLRELFILDGDSLLTLGVNRRSSTGKGESLFFDSPLESLYLGRTLSYSTSYFDGYAPFYEQTHLHTVVVGEKVSSLGDRLFWGCKSLTKVTIGGGVEYIGNYVFKNCTALTDLTLRDGLKPIYLGYNKFESGNIGSPLFSDSPLQSLYLGRTPAYNMSRFYGYSPFYQQKKLSSVTLGETVEQLPNNLFYNCSSLAELEIPASVSVVGNAVFSGCTSLRRVVLNDGAEPLKLGYNRVDIEGQNLFHDTPVESLYLGRNIIFYEGEQYGGAPFSRMKHLQEVEVGDMVTSIGEAFFCESPRLASLTIGGGVEVIGNRAFAGCTSLRRVVLRDGDSPLSLGYNEYRPSGVGRALFYDNPVQSLYVGRALRYPETIAYGYSPFYRKETLTQVTIGKVVTVVGARLFYGCRSLTDLRVEGELSTVGAYAFYGCPAKK